MDKFNELTTGAKLVLGATVAFLIVSFFNWFEADLGGIEEVAGVDAGVSMWNGVGVIAGLIAIVLLVWQAIRLANINLEIGMTPAMITAALAALLLIFTRDPRDRRVRVRRPDDLALARPSARRRDRRRRVDEHAGFRRGHRRHPGVRGRRHRRGEGRRRLGKDRTAATSTDTARAADDAAADASQTVDETVDDVTPGDQPKTS